MTGLLRLELGHRCVIWWRHSLSPEFCCNLNPRALRQKRKDTPLENQKCLVRGLMWAFRCICTTSHLTPHVPHSNRPFCPFPSREGWPTSTKLQTGCLVTIRLMRQCVHFAGKIPFWLFKRMFSYCICISSMPSQV